MFEYTKEQLEGWKKKYGEGCVFEVVVEDRKAVLHKPSRKDLTYATAGSSGGKRERLKEQLAALPLAEINTIHSFCGHLIRTNFFKAKSFRRGRRQRGGGSGGLSGHDAQVLPAHRSGHS